MPSCRPDAERIFMARRIAVRNSLTDYGMSLDDAERWSDASPRNRGSPC
jgi:hypothetical protein